MLQNRMSGKRKLEIDEEPAKFSPSSLHLAPNKRAKIEVMREVLEVITDSRNLLSNFSRDPCENYHSETNGLNSRQRTYPKRVKKDAMPDGIVRLKRESSDKQTMLEFPQTVKSEHIEESVVGENTIGYYLRNQGTPRVKIERIKSENTPTVNTTTKPRFSGSSIKIRRKRRGPPLVLRRCKDKAPKRCNSSSESPHHTTLSEMKETGSSKANGGRNDAVGFAKTSYVIRRMTKIKSETSPSSGVGKDVKGWENVEKGLKGFSSKYNMRRRREIRTNYAKQNVDKVHADKDDGMNDRKETRSSKKIPKRNERNGKRRKVLKPKIRFCGDWDKDIHFGSDEDTDVDAHGSHHYPLRSRINNGVELKSEMTSSECTQSSCHSNDEKDEDKNIHRRRRIVCERGSEPRRITESCKNRDIEAFKVKKEVTWKKGQGSSGKNEVKLKNFSADKRNWSQNEIERLQL